ncbi:nucleotidyltransferase domain-containing protein [Streptomyces rhizosphaericus]|uniref:Nucleotidyltransferase n=1 Tax=Streptomyces rhizosphaericus TaxID=114699 RepID=A0A6G4AHU8_9ACTN|nr:nucleotidyltransferase [Streptomyces rhizosphaericus]NEW72269.1 nucleotidyltransferase [Streptomyces rhizosphaericus]
MATTVTAAFNTLVGNLTRSPGETSSMVGHRESVGKKLSSSFGVTNFFGTGSNSNGTSVRFWSDVDYFASIPVAAQQNDSAYMLTKVRDVLRQRFPSTSIRVSTPAVVCDFGTDGAETLEVTPAYYLGRDDTDSYNVYEIPQLGGGWVKSSPSVHNRYVTDANVPLNGKLKQLIRLIKAVRYYNNIPATSFYLELRVAKWAAGKSVIDYKYDVRGVLSHLVGCSLAQMVDPKGISGYVPAAHTENYREDALSKLTTALNRARKAVHAESDGDIEGAFKEWDKVFNGRFPAYG